MGFLQFLSGPVKGLMDGAAEILGKFVASPEEKIQANQALMKLSMDFQSQLIDADKEFAAKQAEVIEAETKSESWMARNWRPLLMFTFMVIIANNYIIFPYFAAAHMVEIPPDMWGLLKLGMTGYIVGRSVEKVGPDILEAIKK